VAPLRIYAFIDTQNVHLSVRDQGWKIDWGRFRRYLKDKYGVTKAFTFIGYLPGNERLYKALQEAGFVLIFKPTLELKKDRKLIIKGNVDAELVLHTMIEWSHYDKAVIASGDGDFYCLLEHLENHMKLLRLLVPHRWKYSALLRRFQRYFTFMSDLRENIAFKKVRGSTGRTNP